MVRTPLLPLQGAWVGSLVGELKSHKPCGGAIKKERKKERKRKERKLH